MSRRGRADLPSIPAAARAELGFLPRDLLAWARCLDVEAGTGIFPTGGRPALLYYVLEGEIALLRHSAGGQASVPHAARAGLPPAPPPPPREERGEP